MDKYAFYLKINRNERYTIRNLKFWIEVINTFDEADYYVICDNDDLRDLVIDEVGDFFPDICLHIMPSIKNAESKRIVEKVTDERWRAAGYAHVSTFIHARDLGYKAFWNIDADDTRICLSKQRAHLLLDAVEQYAVSERIDAFSLDMHTTMVGSGHHWSFGVTYINNMYDWVNLMQIMCTEEVEKEDPYPNIDRFFRYIRNNVTDVKIESFYFENLKFIHYSNDFFWRLHESAVFHWKDGYLTLPILYYVVGLKNEKTKMKIDSIVKKLDIGITDEESTTAMIKACNDPSFYINL